MVSAAPSPIAPDTLQQFVAQLKHWAESLIREGRSPLRKVETFATLLTAKGELQPPLLFWINRDSCMAGGVVLFPEDNDAEAMETGHYCAQALGLRYFITWTRKDICYWDDETPPRLRKQVRIGKGEKAGTRDFQEALQRLLEEVKLLSVLAAVPPPELSACYLANLWRTTLQKTQPLLNQYFRVCFSESRPPRDELPETLAISKGYLSLFRLLALSHYDLLPTDMQPLQLEEQIVRVLPTLPSHLRSALAMGEGELPLPEQVAVHFHLLFRRLTQLRPASDLPRFCQALALLLEQDHGLLGGHEPPVPPPASALFLVNPDRAYDIQPLALEFGPTPLLAGLALQRHWCGQRAVEQCATLWQSPENFTPHAVCGTLSDQRQLDPDGRNHFLILLRRSWPNRRFPLSADTPSWAWQLLHLLGVAAADANIDLRLPGGWLSSPYGRAILELIQKQFTLKRLCDEGAAGITLSICKTQSSEGLTTLCHQGTSRSLEWSWLNSQHPALLALALYLPEPLLQLLQNELLCLPSPQTGQAEFSEAIFVFSRSTLGQAFWQLLGSGRPLPRRVLLHKEVLRSGLPLPPSRVLHQIQQAISEETSDLRRQRACERELHLWLASDLTTLTAGLPSAGEQPVFTKAEVCDSKELASVVSREVFVDGLPLFPDHYLYDYYRPELRNYSFTLPLSRGPEFFGRVELIDGHQQTLEVETPDTALALLLVAASGKTSIRLPIDSQIITAIVQRYLADLRDLRQALTRSCHRHCTDPEQAQALAETVWAGQTLPDWEFIIASCLS